jgi:hypothetical protein
VGRHSGRRRATARTAARRPGRRRTTRLPAAGREGARRLAAPARFVLLCLGFAALGAASGLFAAGRWTWGILAAVVAAIVLAALAEAARRELPRERTAEGSALAASEAEVWRARLDSRLTRWRIRSRLDALELERGPALRALGDAVWRRDPSGEREARRRLAELERERRDLEAELARRLAAAEERIRRARLPLQETLGVAPNEPTVPPPPPDEGDPPQPAPLPELSAPNEGTPRASAPGDP